MRERAEFVIESGPEHGRVVPLPPGRGTLGSDPRLSHVVLRDEHLAPGHLAVDVQTDATVRVWPVGGPATLDGAPVLDAAVVRPGQRVHIGSTTLLRRRTAPPGDGPRNRPAATTDPGQRRVGAIAAAVGMVLVAVVLLGLLFTTVDAPGALVSLLAAVLPAPLLVALVLAIDRYEPEPRRILALTFFYGATAAVLLAGVLNVAGLAFTSVAFGPAVGEFLTVTLVAPFVEETLKCLAVLVVFWRLRDQFNGVVDAVVYSAMVGLGFAVTENVFYYAEALIEGRDVFTVVVVLRGVFSPFAHPLFTSMFGIGLAIASEAARWRALPPLLGWFGAMFLHGLWNLSTFAGTGFLLVYLMVFVPVFIAVVVAGVVASRREARLIRTYLAEDVHRGLLSPDEVDKLASVRLRRQAERESARLGGEMSKRQRRAFHHAATRLAFLRHRRWSNALHAPSPDEERAWAEEVRRRKAEAKGPPA